MHPFPGAIQNLLSDINATRIDINEARFRTQQAGGCDEVKRYLNRMNYSVIKLRAEREDFRKALTKDQKAYLNTIIEEIEAFIAAGVLRET